MIGFRIEKESQQSRARLGILETPHGTLETPVFVPVATQAVVKTLSSKAVFDSGLRLLIANTFHLHLTPGEEVVRDHGGIHEFMKWPSALMTDSGGFQVFSLGFGLDYGVGKVDKLPREGGELIAVSAQPKGIRITNDGVEFQSPKDGRKLFLGPEESIAIQEKLGADIMFAFDECTPPRAEKAYIIDSLRRTHQWEMRSLEARKSDQALYGIVQGSVYPDLRQESALFIARQSFDGYGIGGDLGTSKDDTILILRSTLPYLQPKKPRHLLGIGHIEDIELMIREGIDTFDCVVPTQYARRGIAFTSNGKIDVRKSGLIREKNPLDPACICPICTTYSLGYIAHLFRAHEISGMSFVTEHNVYFYQRYVAEIRERIKRNAF